MNKVYVLRFNPHYKDYDIEICSSLEMAIECSKAYLEKHEVRSIKTMAQNGITYVWGVNNWYTYGIEIEEKEVFSSVDTFLPARFTYLKKEGIE